MSGGSRPLRVGPVDGTGIPNHKLGYEDVELGIVGADRTHAIASR